MVAERGPGPLVLGVPAGADGAPLSGPAPAALADLFASEYRSLVGLAIGLVGDRGTAEQLVMEAFLRTFAGWHRLRDRGVAPVYLRRCVVNLASNTHRRRRAEQRANQRHAGKREADVASVDPTGADGSLVAALAALPPGKRAVVVLRYWEDRSEAEVAEIMGCAVGTVKSQLAKAMTLLRAALAHTDG